MKFLNLLKWIYCHSVERRGYPEDRGPHPAAPLPPPPTPPPPRVEKKPEIKNIDDILKAPGRLSRPERVLINSCNIHLRNINIDEQGLKKTVS